MSLTLLRDPPHSPFPARLAPSPLVASAPHRRTQPPSHQDPQFANCGSLLVPTGGRVDTTRASRSRSAPDALVTAVSVAMGSVRTVDAAASIAGRPAPLAVLLVLDMLMRPIRTVDATPSVRERPREVNRHLIPGASRPGYDFRPLKALEENQEKSEKHVLSPFSAGHAVTP